MHTSTEVEGITYILTELQRQNLMVDGTEASGRGQ